MQVHSAPLSAENCVRACVRAADGCMRGPALWCMDVVDPELVRLPVLCGARLIVYISWETWHDDGPVPRVEEELAPCLL